MYVHKIYTMIVNCNLTMITSWSKMVNLNCVATGVAKGRHWGLLSWVHPSSMHIYFNNMVWFAVVAFLGIMVQSPNALTQIFQAPQHWQLKLAYEFFSYFLTENLLLETHGIRPYRKLLLKGNEELHLVWCPKIRLCMFIQVIIFCEESWKCVSLYCYMILGTIIHVSNIGCTLYSWDFLLVLIEHRRWSDSGIVDRKSQQLCRWISQVNMKLDAPILYNIFLVQNFAKM
jgi:hypothetical protein